jgi:undecaprenyl diphosphate synthase
MYEQAALPRHIAFILDGNGRWAKARGLSRLEGHRAGLEAARRLADYLAELNIPYVTLFVFSTENWSRPEDEVKGLFRLLTESIRRAAEDLNKRGVRIVHLGRSDNLPASVAEGLEKAVALTAGNTGSTLGLALNYGGRQEIVDATRAIIREGIPAASIDEEMISRHLYTAGMPDVDLIVRTSGEMRISNFLLWQSAYAEYYTTPAYWPDFDRNEMDKALAAYASRQRRFGGVQS